MQETDLKICISIGQFLKNQNIKDVLYIKEIVRKWWKPAVESDDPQSFANFNRQEG